MAAALPKASDVGDKCVISEVTRGIFSERLTDNSVPLEHVGNGEVAPVGDREVDLFVLEIVRVVAVSLLNVLEMGPLAVVATNRVAALEPLSSERCIDGSELPAGLDMKELFLIPVAKCVVFVVFRVLAKRVV